MAGKAKKAGRKRKQGVARTASGRISRAKPVAFEDGPQQTVLQARRRHVRAFSEPEDAEKRDKLRKRMTAPVGKDEAQRLSKRGSVLGCMTDDKHITAEMQAAGDDYCQRYMTYAALNGMPRPTPQGPAYGEVRGSSRPERIKAAMAAKVEHFADQRVLTHCTAGVKWAIKRACVLDEAAPPHLVREGLIALMKARG